LNLALPIRVRLTLWYSLAIAVTMFSIGYICLLMVHHAIDNLENNELQQRVRSVRRFIESRPASESSAVIHDEMKAAYEDSHGNKWLQVIDEHGEWLYRSPHVAAVYPALTLPQNASEDGTYFTYTTESVSVSALIEPITVHGVHYTVQTGLTLTKSLTILSNFRIQIFLLTSVGLFVSSIAGYFMSRKALSPIAAIAAEAQRINDRNLHARLPVPSAKDEISDLSRTLNQMLERINTAFASVRTFTGNASHELRTPISLLRTEIEVALMRSRDPDEYRLVLGRLLEETVRMTNLVENLLALARADGGAESPVLSTVSVNKLFEKTTRSWQHIMQQSGLSFQVTCPDTEIEVLGDAEALNRMISIFLENAFKYTSSGGRVTLCARSVGDRVEISIEDTGLGIPAEYQEKIFERFFRAPGPDSISRRGSGLGLALAKWIAERHGAELKVTSEPGHGSIFSFQLRQAESHELNMPLVEEPTGFNRNKNESIEFRVRASER
jgi:heavy metal sensor kinase